ncbi:MAG: GNAT family N-acetyltransferase, partial [Treponema sp.]|nr:GNAT family N-acetyltransferase [Treponema sp.]
MTAGGQGERRWRRMRRRDEGAAENILFDRERYCAGAAGRYLERNGRDHGWVLRTGGMLSSGASAEVSALILNLRRSLFPILRGDTDIPFPSFIKGLLRSFPLHTVQGLRGEVEFLERGMAALGREPADRFDYDLMALDREPDAGAFRAGPPGLVLRRPGAGDMEELFALQSAYEMEEVLPKGTTFNPAASRLNLAHILANEQILAAELDGRIV